MAACAVPETQPETTKGMNYCNLYVSEFRTAGLVIQGP